LAFAQPASGYGTERLRSGATHEKSHINAYLRAIVRSGASHAAETSSTPTARALVRRMAFSPPSLPASAVANAGGIATASWHLVPSQSEGPRYNPA
jgi:hypothetical protein